MPPASTEGRRTRESWHARTKPLRIRIWTAARYSCHRHIAWLKGHPRWTLRSTPTFCSWTAAVKGFFGKLARCRTPKSVSFDSNKPLAIRHLTRLNVHGCPRAPPRSERTLKPAPGQPPSPPVVAELFGHRRLRRGFELPARLKTDVGGPSIAEKSIGPVLAADPTPKGSAFHAIRREAVRFRSAVGGFTRDLGDGRKFAAREGSFNLVSNIY